MGKCDKYGFNPNLAKDNLTVSMKQFKEVTKLNQELTIENTKLVKQIDLWKSYKDENFKLKNDLELETHFKICEREKVMDFKKKFEDEVYFRSVEVCELQQIKSTRLYKFFKWLGVW